MFSASPLSPPCLVDSLRVLQELSLSVAALHLAARTRVQSIKGKLLWPLPVLSSH